MQRIIPFGRDYAQSAEFSVDEGQTVRFWLVRQDYTTTLGQHSFAELQVKSAVGNDHWTTIAELTGDAPSYDLIGVDENTVYRWVRKPCDPIIAVDRSQDGAYSRTQRARLNEAGDRIVLPAIGRNELLWADSRSFVEVARTKVHGQPVFAVARPDGRHVWVNFAHPNNDTIQVVDTLSGDIVKEWKPGPAILHMEFAPRGHQVWVSLRDANAVHVYDTHTFAKLGEIAADSPSGIFLTARAHRTGL